MPIGKLTITLPVVLGAAFGLFIVVPAVVSLASGKGPVCLQSSSCPLAAVNPCVRTPSLAIVGRCSVDIE